MTLSIGTQVTHTDGRTGVITEVKESRCQKGFDGQTYCTPPRYFVTYGESAEWADKKLLTQTAGGAPEPVPISISVDSSSVKLMPGPSASVDRAVQSKKKGHDSKSKWSLEALLKDKLLEFANDTHPVHHSVPSSLGGHSGEQRRVETCGICEDDATDDPVEVHTGVVHSLNVQHAESDNEYNQTPPPQSPTGREEFEADVAELQKHHNVTQTLSQVVRDNNSRLSKVEAIAMNNKLLLTHIEANTRVMVAQAETHRLAQDQQKSCPRALFPSKTVIHNAAVGTLVLALCLYLCARPYFTPGVWLHNIWMVIVRSSYDVCQAICDTFLAMCNTVATLLYIAMQSVSAWFSSVNSGVQKYLSEARVGLASTLRSWADGLAVLTPIDVDIHPEARPTVFEHVVGTVINVMGYCLWS